PGGAPLPRRRPRGEAQAVARPAPPASGAGGRACHRPPPRARVLLPPGLGAGGGAPGAGWDVSSPPAPWYHHRAQATRGPSRRVGTAISARPAPGRGMRGGELAASVDEAGARRAPLPPRHGAVGVSARRSTTPPCWAPYRVAWL